MAFIDAPSTCVNLNKIKVYWDYEMIRALTV